MPLRGGAAVSQLAQVVLAAGVRSAELAGLLAEDADVEYAVPDERRRIVAAPDDPLYAAGVGGRGPDAGQWYLRAPSGDVRSSLDIEPAWAVAVPVTIGPSNGRVAEVTSSELTPGTPVITEAVGGAVS